MNLLCPNCQKMLSVEDRYAGQLMRCPLCNGTFTVPALAADPPPSRATPPPPPAPAFSSPGPAHAEDEPEHGTYSLAAHDAPPEHTPPPLELPPLEPEAEPAARPTPRRSGRGSNGGRSSLPPADLALTSTTPPPVPPPPPPPGDYAHTLSFHLNPQVLSWIAPVCAVFLFFLLFFHWAGAYPGGYGVYTESGFQTMYGGFSADEARDRIMGKHEQDIEDNRGGSLLMVLYFLLLLVLVVIAVASVVLPRLDMRASPAVQRLLPLHQKLQPWQSAIIAVLALFTLLLLLVQLAVGLPLERAIAAYVNKTTGPSEGVAASTEGLAIERGRREGEFHLQRTRPLSLVVLLHLVAGVAAGLEFWLLRRGARPLPRAVLNW